MKVLLNELGLDSEFLDVLRKDYLQPISNLLYPSWTGASGLDSHKAFTVEYMPRGDVDLDYHFDNAEVSANVCLGRDFDGGSLFFGKMKTVRPLPFILEHVLSLLFA